MFDLSDWRSPAIEGVKEVMEELRWRVTACVCVAEALSPGIGTGSEGCLLVRLRKRMDGFEVSEKDSRIPLERRASSFADETVANGRKLELEEDRLDSDLCSGPPWLLVLMTLDEEASWRFLRR